MRFCSGSRKAVSMLTKFCRRQAWTKIFRISVKPTNTFRTWQVSQWRRLRRRVLDNFSHLNSLRRALRQEEPNQRRKHSKMKLCRSMARSTIISGSSVQMMNLLRKKNPFSTASKCATSWASTCSESMDLKSSRWKLTSTRTNLVSYGWCRSTISSSDAREMCPPIKAPRLQTTCCPKSRNWRKGNSTK